jgi:site-specific DNA-adenine methylase
MLLIRIGSKETDIKFFKHLLPLDVETVVEVFGGSFAVIKHFYKNLDKYKFNINDLDDDLFYIYNNYNEMIDKFKELNEKYIESFEYKNKEFKLYFDSLEMNDQFKELCI